MCVLLRILLSAFATRAIIAQQHEHTVFESLEIIGKSDEFKYVIPAKTEECFHTVLNHGSHLAVSFEVLKGKTKTITVTVKGPDGQELESRRGVNKGYIEKMATFPDNSSYAVCFDNKFSRLASKRMSIFIGSWQPMDWYAYKDDFILFDLSANATRHTIDDLSMATRVLKRDLFMKRRWDEHDLLVVQQNRDAVDLMASCMCVVILMTSAFQVYFVRRLFHLDIGNKKAST